MTMEMYFILSVSEQTISFVNESFFFFFKFSEFGMQDLCRRCSQTERDYLKFGTPTRRPPPSVC